MANLTIKTVPDPLLRRLKAQAARHRRSLNSEVIACLEAAVGPTVVNPDALLAEIRALRPPVRRPVTDRLLNRLKRAGRM
jgi:plasmid stability protein